MSIDQASGGAVNDGESLPHREMIFHYTRGQGLHGIIKDKALWATQIQYLNDRREFLFVFETAARYIHALTVFREDWAKRHPSLASAIEYGLVQSAPSGGRQIFVVSFTTRWDDLSQWRAYCGDEQGYAIGFNARELRKLAEARGWRFLQCAYGENSRNAEIVAAIKETFQQWESKAITTEARALEYLVNKLLPIAPTTKDHAFEAEDEWRLVGPVADAADPAIPHQTVVQYRPSSTTLIPYVEFSLDDSWPAIIPHLIIGPGPNADLAGAAASGLLRSSGVNVGPGESVVPYRPLR